MLISLYLYLLFSFAESVGMTSLTFEEHRTVRAKKTLVHGVTSSSPGQAGIGEPSKPHLTAPPLKTKKCRTNDAMVVASVGQEVDQERGSLVVGCLISLPGMYGSSFMRRR